LFFGFEFREKIQEISAKIELEIAFGLLGLALTACKAL